MARIRSIKPTFWADEGVAELSRDARLLAIGLISFADDEGRFLASTAAISGYVFPHDDLPARTIRRWLDEVEAAGIVRLYSVSRREYGAFPNWSKHQRINRPTASLIPAPPSPDVPTVSDSVSGSVSDSLSVQCATHSLARGPAQAGVARVGDRRQETGELPAPLALVGKGSGTGIRELQNPLERNRT